MRTKSLLFVLVVSVALIFVSTPIVFAQTGKITGRVIDKDTGEPLWGANVTVVGTGKGAMVNEDGLYTIFIRPGTYDVQVSFIGYSPQTKTGVLVKLDLTTELNFEMSQGAIDLDIVIDVSGQRDMIQKDITSSESRIGAEEITNMPVANFQDILALTAGAKEDASGDLHFRGGRTGEVLYNVDGMSVRDVQSNDAGLQPSNNAIAEVVVISGGFPAEFGNAQSAVVNVVTKEGSVKRYTGGLEYRTDDFGNPNADYSWNSDVVNFNFGGPEPLTQQILPSLGFDLPGDVTFFLSGEGQFTNGYVEYDNYPYASQNIFGIDFTDRRQNFFNLSSKLAYQITPKHKLTYSYNSQRQKYYGFDRPWNWISYLQENGDGVDGNAGGLSGGVGGTTIFGPTLGYPRDNDGEDDDGNPNTPARADGIDNDGDGLIDEGIDEELPNGIDDDGDWVPFSDWNGNGVLDYVDYNGNGIFDNGIDRQLEPLNSDWNGNGVPDYDWDGYGTAYENRVLYDANSDQDMFWDPEPGIDEDLNSYYMFDPYTGEQYNPTIHNNYVHTNSNLHTLEWSHTLSSNTFYKIRASRFNKVTWSDTQGKEPWQYVARQPFSSSEGYRFAGDDLFWTRDGQTTYTFKADITSQVVPKYHQMKSGIEIEYFDIWDNQIQYPYDYHFGQEDPGAPYQYWGNYRYFWHVYSWAGAAYVQDKMEFEGMIVNVGIRYDFWDVGKQAARETTARDVDGDGRQDSAYDFDGDGIDDPIYALDRNLDGEVSFSERIHDQISPRIGISHPITDKDKLFFSYGHFSQRPKMRQVYTKPSNTGDIPLRGNPQLGPEKTVLYELGVEHAFNDRVLMKITGFYKDITDLVNTQQVIVPPFTYSEYVNSAYGGVRGFELSFTKRYSNYTAGFFNYTYSIASGNASSDRQGYDFQNRGVELPLSESALDWDERHTITTNFDFRVPKDEPPTVFGVTLPDDWGMNLVWRYGSGLPYTPSAELSGENVETKRLNAYRLPWTMSTDLRFNKNFTYAGLDYEFFLWVENLFDRKNVTGVYSSSGKPDYNGSPIFNADGEIVGYEEEPGGFYTFKDPAYGETSYWRNPTNYDPGRRVQAGFRVQF
ncbi:MAG: TonB-dependent receptor [Gemmatimonadetes bacterium]|nr:MAG: TonB-dependent receptor [Gemmatimonadota bacterium]